MPNTTSVIKLALSKLGVAGGLKDPRPEDMELGLTTLQSYYRNLITSGALGTARRTLLDSSKECYTAGENEIILRTSEEVDDIQLPLSVPSDGSCGYDDYGIAWAGGSRSPRNGKFVVINDAFTGASMEWIYDGYINQWCSIHDLSLDQDSWAPLASDINGVAARLAVMMADHYDATLHQMTVRDALLFDTALVQSFGEDTPPMPGNYF